MTRALLRTTLVGILLAGGWSVPAWSDTGTSLGDKSGEGSTLFTGLSLAPEANQFTGALTTSVPIVVPPGRNDFTPKLSFQYQSNAGPSPFGYGWDIPIGRIERSTKYGTPRCSGPHTDDFVIVLPNTTAELVQDPPGSGYYRPAVEQSYLRVQKETASNRWVAYDRAGIRYEFGTVVSARAATHALAPFLVSLSDGSCVLTTAWALTRIVDPNGNHIDIEWYNVVNTLMPRAIHYGGNLQTNLPHLYHVTFNYNERCSLDVPLSYRTGVFSQISWRLAWIDVQLQPDAAPATQIRRYRAIYSTPSSGGAGCPEPQPDHSEPDPDIQPDGEYQSQLIGMEVTGHPGYVFSYTPSVAGHSDDTVPLTPPTGITDLRVSTTSLEVTQTLLDMNSDGLVDIVKSNSPDVNSWDVYYGFANEEAFGFHPTPVPWTVPTVGSCTPGTGSCFRFENLRTVWNNDETSYTIVDTFDINGDGLPDLVSGADRPLENPNYTQIAPEPGLCQPSGDGCAHWTVWPAIVGPDQKLRFGSAQSWIAPEYWIRVDRDGRTTRDVVDMNGDGLPDLIVTSGWGTTGGNEWRVYLNNGQGFDLVPLPHFPAPRGSLQESAGGDTWHMLVDFNGDGLPDLLSHPETGPEVNGDCWEENETDVFCLQIYWNTGQGFASNVSTVRVPWGGGLQNSGPDGDGPYLWTHQDVVDISGDGLPDFVRDFGPEWKVQLNTGGRVEPVELEYLSGGPVGHGRFPRIWPGGGAGNLREQAGTAGERSLVDFIDLNGDGMLDHVVAGDNSWEVRLNQLVAKPNLLSIMENGLGGETTVAYQPSTLFDNSGGDAKGDLPFVTWVVGGMHQNDGICPDAVPEAEWFDPVQNTCLAKGHHHITQFEYTGGRFDAPSREFRGFREVVREGIEAPGQQNNRTITTFYQTDYVRGQMRQVTHYAGADQMVAREDYGWMRRSLGTPVNRQQIWAYSKLETRTDLAPGTLEYFATLQLVLDDYGNVTTLLETDYHTWVQTRTQYAVPDTGWETHSKPSYTESESGAVYQSGTVFRKKWFRYDGTTDPLAEGAVQAGNLRKVESWLNSGSEPSNVVTRMDYDPFGNMTKTWDARNMLLTTEYDAYALYPYRVTNALGHQMTTATDYRWGKPTRVVDANDAVTQYAYDNAGRLICLARDGDSITSCPSTIDPCGDNTAPEVTERYTYRYAGSACATSGYSWVTTERREPNQGTGYLPVTTFMDGLGRPRYTETWRVVNGSVAAQPIIVDDTVYDAGGRMTKRYDPYPGPFKARNNGVRTVDYHLNGNALGLLDPLGRPYQVTKSDGGVLTTKYAGALTTTIDEAGTRRVTTRSGFGRVLREEVYNGAVLYAYTVSTYDVAGQLQSTAMNDNVNTSVTYAYDTLGRKTAMHDPDSGDWEYKYDANGNLVFQNDPKPGQHVEICYDALNRPAKKRYYPNDVWQGTACQDPADETYTYDAIAGGNKGVGRLTSVVDQSGTTSFKYDARGRTTSVTKSILAQGVETSATTAFAYDEADRVKATTYPDGEVVYTDYDPSGQPIALRNNSNESYVEHVYYDLFGRVTELAHANTVTDTRAYYGMPGSGSFSSTGHRLKQMKTAKGLTSHLDLQYGSYDARGLITGVSDARNPTDTLSNSRGFEYDHLGRLTRANGQDGDLHFTHDALGNLTSRGVTGSMATFYYGNPTKPHQVTNVLGPYVFLGMTYDANGNREQKASVATPSGTYTYDAADRLERIALAPTGQEIDFVYDYTGQQVAKTASGITTRYYSQLVETSSSGSVRYTMKWYVLGGQRVASRRTEAAGWETAALRGAVWLARTEMEQPSVVIVLDQGTRRGAGVGFVVLGTALIFAPRWRRRGVREGHALGLMLVIVIGTLPWPLMVRGEEPGCGTPATEVRHYHFDHLGSLQTITRQSATAGQNGTIVEQIRYDVYGKIRGRWDGSGAAITSPTAEHRYEFTGYETELASGLQYAGARFYDPEVGSFLTHDPKRVFSSPYSYLGGDPVNDVDVNGENPLLVFAIGFLIGFAVSATEAALSGANASQSLQAGLVGGAIGGVTGVGLGLIAGPQGLLAQVGGEGLRAAFNLAMVGVGNFLSNQSLESGQYVAGSVGVVLTVMSLSQFAQGGNGEPGSDGILRGSGGDIVIDQESPFAGYDGEVTLVGGGQTPANPDNLSGLQPGFREKVELTMIELEQQGWEPRVAEGLRTPAQQAEKFRLGYSPRPDVSAHLKGYGADIIDRRWGWTGPAANKNFRFWHGLAGTATRYGLESGRFFRSVDVAHVQMPNWRRLP